MKTETKTPFTAKSDKFLLTEVSKSIHTLWFASVKKLTFFFFVCVWAPMIQWKEDTAVVGRID